MKDAKITDLIHRVVAARASALTPAAEVILPGIPASVGAARRLVSVTLPGCPRLDDLVLAVSELASNAVIWSASGEGGTFTVRVRIAPRWARCEVTDDGPAVLTSGQGTGLGLILVAEVTDRSGAIIGAGASRTAWAEVSWPAPPGVQWTATAKFGQHDRLPEWSAADLPEETGGHWSANRPEGAAG